MAETYYSLTDIVKLCDNLVEAMPTSFYNGIWKVRNTLYRIPAADVVARDCFDKILAENDDMRAIIDTYGGMENIQSAFVKLHEIETADVAPVVRCKDCKHRDPEDKKCDCGGLEHAHMFPVADDWFCADGKRKGGDANVQNWEKNHLRPTNMSGTKCEPCKPTQPECGDCEYIKDGDGDGV